MKKKLQEIVINFFIKYFLQNNVKNA